MEGTFYLDDNGYVQEEKNRCKDCYVKEVIESERYCADCLKLHKLLENLYPHLYPQKKD